VQLLLIAQTERLDRPTAKRFIISVSSTTLFDPVQPNPAKQQEFFQILVGYTAIVFFWVKTLCVCRRFGMAYFVQ
jgi:hypothetical protein